MGGAIAAAVVATGDSVWAWGFLVGRAGGGFEETEDEKRAPPVENWMPPYKPPARLDIVKDEFKHDGNGEKQFAY